MTAPDVRKSKFYSRDCKLCGAPLSVLITPEGNQVGLDLSVPVYAPTVKDLCVRTDLSYADHRSVCKKL